MIPGILKTREGFYVLQHDSHLSRWIEQRGRLDVAEEEIRKHFTPFIRAGDTVIDAGASLGDHSATYAQLVGATGHVLAFEPNRLPFECLKQNMARFGQVRCFNYALGGMQGGVEFERDDNAGASHIMPDGKTDPKADVIAVTTLDKIALPELTRCDFIHLDAEGYEPFILDGARELLKKYRPVLTIEINHGHLNRYHQAERDLRIILHDLEYKVEEIEGTPASEQRDILAFPV